MEGRIVFISPMCLLDRRSGAAVTVRTWLELLAAAGCECEALTMAVFDGDYEYPLARVFRPEVVGPAHHGKLVLVERAGVRHWIFYTASTRGQKVTPAEQRRFLAIAGRFLAQRPPALAIAYGSSAYSRALHDLARARSRRFLFYLANLNFRDPGYFHPDDVIICPSRWAAGYYREKLGLATGWLGSIVLPQSRLGEAEGDAAERFPRAADRRRSAFVTLVNPCPPKGLTLFVELLRRAARERPEITFLAVEGRLPRPELAAFGLTADAFPNLWWLPNQMDMRRVYRRTAVLLVPSFCLEAAGRVAAEAQLSGIPVLASARGGLPEQLNGGGFLFPLAPELAADHRRRPRPNEVHPWFETIVRLFDDDAFYAAACARARAAAAPFTLANRRRELLELFGGLLSA